MKKRERMESVVVIGAGIMGVTSAYYLRKNGLHVTVLEQNASPAAEGTSSFQNGGLFCPGIITPWSGPGTLSRVMRSFFERDAPMKVKMGSHLFDTRIWSFLWKFRGFCMSGTENFNNRLFSLSKLSYLSLSKYNQLCAEYPDLRTPNPSKGTLSIYMDENDCENDLKQINFMRQQLHMDPAVTMKGPEAGHIIKSNYVPHLSEVYAKKIKGAILTTEDTSGDTRKVTEKLQEKCSLEGVKFYFNEKVIKITKDGNKITGVTTDKGNTYLADNFVVTTGCDVQLLERIGISLPIYPFKGFSLNVPLLSSSHISSLPSVAITERKEKIYVSRVNDSIRMSGYVELNGYDKTLDPRKKEKFYQYLEKIVDVNNLDFEKSNFHTCHRPVSPDDVPLIGAVSSVPNLFVNAGQGSGGWTMAFGSGFLLAGLVAKTDVEIDPKPFDPNRFL